MHWVMRQAQCEGRRARAPGLAQRDVARQSAHRAGRRAAKKGRSGRQQQGGGWAGDAAHLTATPTGSSSFSQQPCSAAAEASTTRVRL